MLDTSYCTYLSDQGSFGQCTLSGSTPYRYGTSKYCNTSVSATNSDQTLCCRYRGVADSEVSSLIGRTAHRLRPASVFIYIYIYMYTAVIGNMKLFIT
jgi:hypothetical protein